jgi:hypothetical protein
MHVMAEGLMPPVGVPCLDAFARTGIYFLYYAGAVVYVGRAVDMRRRIGQHIGEGAKAFDAVAFTACPVGYLDATERRFIAKFLPKYNGCAFATKLRRELGEYDVSHAKLSTTSYLMEDEEAAAFLGIAAETLREWAQSGIGPRPRRLPRCRVYKYNAQDLRAFVATNRV